MKTKNVNGKREHKKEYWICIIGAAELENMPVGLDAPMRNAVEKAFKKLFKKEAEKVYSGWGLGEKTVKKVLKAWD